MGPRLCNFKGIQFFLIWLVIPIFGHSAYVYSFIQRILRTRKEKILLRISSVHIQTPHPPPPQYGFSVSVWFHLINSQYMLNIIPHIWQGCPKTNPNIQHEIIFFNSFSMTICQNLQCELLTRNYIFYCVFWFYVKWASNYNISAK